MESSTAPGATTSRNRCFRVLWESSFQEGFLTCRRLQDREQRHSRAAPEVEGRQEAKALLPSWGRGL